MINLSLLPASIATRQAVRRSSWAISLQRALHREHVSWPLFCLLLSCAERPRTIASAARSLEVEHQRVRQHLLRHPHLFHLSHSNPTPTNPTILSLSLEGETLLTQVLTRAK